MKIGILLSGCGVYDGAEIQEAVLTMLAIEQQGAEYVCIGIDKKQHHVINHLDGSEMPEERNMLFEAARIARGNIVNINDIQPKDIDALVIPGGFGSAKNFTSWAFDGPDGTILPEVKLLLVNLYNVGKPIAALCVSPVVLAKAFEGTNVGIQLSLGSTKEASPFDIASFHQGITKLGIKAEEKTIHEILIDKENKIVTAPCYMMEAKISDIQANINQAITALRSLI